MGILNMSNWQNVAKPNGTSYANVNPTSKTQYDDSMVTYDSALVFYDGGDPNAWTDVTKPGAQSWTNVAKPS